MGSVLAAWVLASSLAQLEEISGTVELVAQGRPLRAEEAREVVVYFRPSRAADLVPAAEPLQMAMARKQFEPRVLAVTVGDSVRFPNFDPILHNVFSSSAGNRFDLGLYGEGPGESYRFDRPGLVRVFCNVHQDMVGHILVLDTPHFTRPDGQGRFRLLVSGTLEGELFAWHERASLWRMPLVEAATEPLMIRLELNRPRVPDHANKFGRPYGRQGRQRY